jgi:hypothetical protein
MDDAARFGKVLFSAVQSVVDGEEVLWRKLVGPFDELAFSGAGVDGEARNGATIGPERGRGQIAMKLRGEGAHGDAVVRDAFVGVAGRGAMTGRFGNGEKRKRIDEAGERGGIEVGRCGGCGVGLV